MVGSGWGFLWRHRRTWLKAPKTRLTWFRALWKHIWVFALSIYLAKFFNGDSAVQEKKRHDLAVERYEKEYQENRTELVCSIATNDHDWWSETEFREHGLRIETLQQDSSGSDGLPSVWFKPRSQGLFPGLREIVASQQNQWKSVKRFTSPMVSAKYWRPWKSWLRKLESLKMSRDSGWRSRPSGT